MAQKQKAKQTTYERAREAFQALDLEARMRFLIEGAAATMAQGIEAAGQTLGTVLEDLFQAACATTEPAEADTASSGPGEGRTKNAGSKKPSSGARRGAKPASGGNASGNDVNQKG
ncbi:MAG: hypothetical protein D6746_11665 [Bacteroidetes bacterium]|nr:MAG: hypothetical protein D6746_11665 [Bacteroidota bacterium]